MHLLWPSSGPFILMKSFARPRGERHQYLFCILSKAHLNRQATRDTSGLAGLQVLGCVSDVKHRPAKPLQAGDHEHGKSDFGPHSEKPTAEKTNLVVCKL